MPEHSSLFYIDRKRWGNTMKKYFFESIHEAVLYLIFLSLIPLVSIFAQYMVKDKTMYVSFLVAGFAMTYDYFVLFGRKICKRLWWEALISTICLLLTTSLGIVNLILLLTSQEEHVYGWKDLLFIALLFIVLAINVFEFVLLLKKDYAKKYDESEETRLVAGAQKV